MKTAILGAGVSGLALARALLEEGIPLEDLHLFEAAPVVGGLIGSKQVDGYTYDIAGGHILYGRDKKTIDWMVNCAGGEEAFETCARHTRIRFGDRWVRYPFENGLGDLPPDVNAECLEAYIKAHEARKTSGSVAPADFASWIRWRFGDGIADHFMVPYNEKIWKRNLADMTSDWVADRVPDAPVEDVIAASRGENREGYTHQSVFRYPSHGGFGSIANGIASVLKGAIRLSTPVVEVRSRAQGQTPGAGWNVNGEDFDVVVSTLPLTEMPGIVPEMPTEVADAMTGLAYNSLVSILVALDHDDVPDLSWVYLPHADQGPANRITYMSNYSRHNAPEGCASLLCEVNFPGGPQGPGEPDSSLEEELLAGLAHAGIIERPRVLFTDRTTMRHAYVVFDHSYRVRREAALAWLDSVGLNPLGRFGRFEYDNSDACVAKARTLARKLARA
jgi:protoporphyrinogen oxidase